MGAVAVVEAVDGRGNPLRVEALDRDRQVEIDAGLHKILPGFGGECLICIAAWITAGTIALFQAAIAPWWRKPAAVACNVPKPGVTSVTPAGGAESDVSRTVNVIACETNVTPPMWCTIPCKSSMRPL